MASIPEATETLNTETVHLKWQLPLPVMTAAYEKTVAS
jgi:hypothetical protein